MVEPPDVVDTDDDDGNFFGDLERDRESSCLLWYPSVAEVPILKKRRKRLGLKKRFRILATVFVYVPSKKKLLRSSEKKVNQSVNLLRNIFS